MKTLPSGTRRSFLAAAASLSTSPAALAPFALSLAGIGAAAAQSSNASDYKALVCIWLQGGNDAFNTVLNNSETSWNAYLAARGGTSTRSSIALDRTALHAFATDANGRRVALHPKLSELAALYRNGSATATKLAIVANVGPLAAPTTLDDLRADRVARPPKLGSHNDQSAVWQSLSPDGLGGQSGWGTQLIDLLADPRAGNTFARISTTGNVHWLSGGTEPAYGLSARGAQELLGSKPWTPHYVNAQLRQTMRELGVDGDSHALTTAHSQVFSRSIASAATISSAFAASTRVQTAATRTKLADRLEQVARLIEGRAAIGLKRQVFMVALPGFDTHKDQVDGHAKLMEELSSAMDYFRIQLEAIGCADKVVTFTASEFGRALRNNGDGTDHGWGGHHFVMGGGVKGGLVHGTLPEVGFNTQTAIPDFGGALIPTRSVEQYASEFARWMGVSTSNINVLLPNLNRFVSPLDFLT